MHMTNCAINSVYRKLKQLEKLIWHVED